MLVRRISNLYNNLIIIGNRYRVGKYDTALIVSELEPLSMIKYINSHPIAGKS